MQHRRKENYDELYKKVHELIRQKGWAFKILPGGKMFMDMETANKVSVQECLNDPDIWGFFFHLSGITNKTTVDLGKKLFPSPTFNHNCKMINALANVLFKRAFDKVI